MSAKKDQDCVDKSPFTELPRGLGVGTGVEKSVVEEKRIEFWVLLGLELTACEVAWDLERGPWAWWLCTAAGEEV